MINVIDLLKEFNEISDYRVITNTQSSYELFFVHEKLETVRSTDSSEIEVTIYVDHKKYRGDSTFTISKSDTKEVIIDHIKNAINMAKLINNKKYNLPKLEKTVYNSDSNFNEFSLKDLGVKLYNILRSEEASSRAQLNATEIFIYKNNRHIVNSQGIDKEETSYRAMIETIPTYDKKKDSVEIYTQLNFTNYDETWLKKQIKQALKDVTARARAKKLDEEINCNVLLRPFEIAQLVGQYAIELNYSSLYNKTNLFNKGDDLQKDSNGDKLSVTMVGQIKNSAQSQAFDVDGITLGKKKIINNGIVVNNFGSNRFAQYVHKKTTGALSLVEVKKGTFKEKELKSAPYLECASFSGLQVDLANDYIGGEVRLAYYYDGAKVRSLTGLSISGKISEVMKSIEFSNKIVCESRYKGPSYALLKNIKIF